MRKQPGVTQVEIDRIQNGTREARPDLLVTEEPLEIQIGYGPAADRKQKSISVTMRTPGADFELALGFLFSEGILHHLSQFKSVDYCRNVRKPEELGNVVRVELQPDFEPDLEGLERNFYMTSSCGVCGKGSIEALEKINCQMLPREGRIWSAEEILKLSDLARDAQTLFRHTGGIHAASLFDAKTELVCQHEDVGRHNAVDKVAGAMFQRGEVPLSDHLLLLSGRAGFELVQKSIRAGIPLVAAVGAPSSLAVSLAEEFGLTLIGFLREGRFNVYSGKWRVG